MNTLRTTEIFNDSSIKLVAVESVNVWHNKTNAGVRLFGSIEPLVIVVYGPGGTYALDMAAKTVDLEQLSQDAPELLVDDIHAKENHEPAPNDLRHPGGQRFLALSESLHHLDNDVI